VNRAEICGACGHANPPESRFCGGCGAQLIGEISCAACGASNPADQRFCNRCGSALEAAAPQEATAGPPPAEGPEPVAAPADIPATPEHLAAKIRAGRSSLEGERKQVTVLFADVVGSMELSEQADTELWRQVMNRFFSILSEGIHRFEGTVDKFTGDGAMALFGAPIAHEDHARRACYAALHLQERLGEWAGELRRSEGLNVSVRMGLNSGEVVVGAIGDDLGMEYTAVGHTVGLAQRMESLAESGKAYLTGDTAALVEGYLALEPLGEFQVKGVSQPLSVYELKGPGSARGRLDVSIARGLSRFVGRDDEMQELGDALERAVGGDASVIGIIGEAGVGKSRLCHEFAQRCRARGLPVYHATGQAHTSSVPLLPVLQLMRSYFDIVDQDDDQTARERIAGKLLLLDPEFADDLPLIFDFLAVPDPERPPARMDPEARQRRLLDLTKRLIRAQSARNPGVTLFEDLHWIDPASEAFLANHVEAVSGTRSLTVVNFRPEYSSGWMSKDYYRQLALAPLGPEETEQMLAGLLGSHPSLSELPAMIRERTGGNPFFMEEVVQSLVERGNLEGTAGAFELVRPVDQTEVPATVHAVLAARIDRLPEREKALLQLGAVIGKEFSQPVLERASELEAAELSEALRELVAGEFLYEQELYPEAIYAFKHPLTMEVAYGSQLADRRAASHAKVATAIAEHEPERLDERAALLADHWEAAGEQLESARWHARAAAWTGTHQPVQSLEHWQRVRELSDGLPESAETTALGLSSRLFTLQYAWRLGMGHDEAERLFKEAERIASRTGDIHSRAILLSVYGGIRGTSDGEPREFAQLARQAIALAEESEDPALYVTVALSAYALFVVGDNEDGVRVLDRAIELADDDPSVGAGIAVACPLAYCYAFKGGIVAAMGRIGEARELIERGARIAREQDDIETLGWSHMWRVWLGYYEGTGEGQLAHAQQSLEIAERLGDSFSRTWSWYWLGYAQKELGEFELAVEALERARALSKDRRTAVEAEPYRLAVLGEAYAGLGDIGRAGELAQASIELARNAGQRAAELLAAVSYARVYLQALGAAARPHVEPVIARGFELVESTDSHSYTPLLHVESAELAGRVGDEETRQRQLGEAHRLFTEIGASARAAAVAAELAEEREPAHD
jgi:class 3 adenylate cyclase/tetratricopeptide (TPR) repeat protein